MSEYYITPGQLCIGVFVELDLGWMEHPFTFGSFRIKSQEQIELLKRLGLQRIRYDPNKSSNKPLPAQPAEAAAAQSSIDGVLNEMQARKSASIAKLRGIRSDIEQMERRFIKVADSIKNITRNLQTKPEEAVKETNAVVAQMVEVMMADGDIALHALGEKLGDDVYLHSLNVAVLSLTLCKAAEMSGDVMHQVGVGAMLHDIGKAEIPYKVVSKTEPLTKAETALMRMHCEFGLKLAARMGLSPDAYAIIMQHHECVDGSGYPRGINGEQMSLASKVVSIVNEYDNLCNPVNVAHAITPSEALSQMFALRRAKFDDRLLRLFIKRMGIYPPGSLVQLSNEMIGLVVSVNSAQPLKPNVLVYDATIPKDDALIISLDSENDLKVTKSLRPAQLPRKVHQYLNPRKNVTYFFDPKAKGGAP